MVKMFGGKNSTDFEKQVLRVFGFYTTDCMCLSMVQFIILTANVVQMA